MARRRISLTTALRERIPVGARVLVAVSGGRDSVVLLHGLRQVQRLLSLTLEVCHVDHRLRDSSRGDAVFVETQCSEWSIPCHVVRLTDKPPGENLEAWARRHRYAAFSRLLAERNLDLVATAHNANDVAETILMRLIANKELNTIEEFDPQRRCVRPLTEITRDQIDEYVREYDLSYVDDPSNSDSSFVRNRIRHKLLPLLIEEFDRSSVWILAEQARSIAEDCDALHHRAEEVAARIGPLEQSSSIWLSRCRSEISELPSGVRWRVVQLLFAPLLGFSIGRSKARAISEVLLGESPGLALGAGGTLTCDEGGLHYAPS